VRGINQGDLYWVQLPASHDPALFIPHPYVIVQENPTIEACALTSNLKRISVPGNVLLDAGEANLLKPSVVEVSKVSILDKTQLGDYIGSVSDHRIQQILAGIRFVQTYFPL